VAGLRAGQRAADVAPADSHAGREVTQQHPEQLLVRGRAADDQDLPRPGLVPGQRGTGRNGELGKVWDGWRALMSVKTVYYGRAVW
jgi:hypothetical protein